ncbi:MAG: hypothetical protein ABSD08_16910 [Xanthobacteraceae bacterium]
MSNGNDQLARAVQEAAREGEIAAPTGLIALIGGLENSLQALQNMDRANELFDALDKEFGFIRFSFWADARIPAAQIQPADQLRYASLLRWLIRELRAWRRADPRQDKLVTAFVVAQRCDSDNGLWNLLPNEIGENIDLLDHLKGMIASFAVTFEARPGAQVPIWEGEAVEEFKRADAEDDWVAIIRSWPQFRYQLFFANTLQIQAVRLLYRYSFARLVEGLASLHQTPVTMQVAGVLSAEQRLRLAIGSDNPHVQIAAMYRTLTDDRSPQKLTDLDRDLLTELLLKVANDTSRWAEWMKVFVGYPALQISLGRALAKGPDAAIDGYVNSIWLVPRPIQFNTSRRLVAECLREFRAYASSERRRALWTRAHERWLHWDFDRANSSQHLTAINRSDLDYAIVGYASECMDEVGREAALNGVRAEAQSLEHYWHGSFNDILGNWYRLVSKFQPYAHASYVVANDEDWSAEARIYFLIDPSVSQYILMMYNMAWPPTVIR